MNNRPNVDSSPMSWQVTLASFGIVIGATLLVYLICRCCRSFDPVAPNTNESPSGFRLRIDAGRLFHHKTRASEVPRIATTPVPPSAKAEPQYYPNYRAMENI